MKNVKLRGDGKQLFDFAVIVPVFLDVGTFVFYIYGIDDEKALKGL